MKVSELLEGKKKKHKKIPVGKGTPGYRYFGTPAKGDGDHDTDDSNSGSTSIDEAIKGSWHSY